MRLKTIIFLALCVPCFYLSPSSADDCMKAVELYNKATLSGDFITKERLFREALTLSCPDKTVLARIHNNLGDAYENTNRLNEAIGEYKEAVKLDPGLSTSYVSLGDVYSKMGSRNDAREYYNKYWGLASLKTRAQLTDALSLRSTQRAIVPVPRTDLYFGFNEAIVTEGSTRQLEELLAAITGNELRSYTFELAGHTCDIGSDAYNQKLSERRADTVERWLVAHGYPSPQLKAKGFGKKKPVTDNSTEEGKKLNRRVEIVTTGAVISGKRSMGKGAELFERGRSLSNEGKYEEAAAHFEKALDNFKEGQSQDEMRAALANLYLTYLAMGDAEKAFHYQREMQDLK